MLVGWRRHAADAETGEGGRIRTSSDTDDDDDDDDDGDDDDTHEFRASSSNETNEVDAFPSWLGRFDDPTDLGGVHGHEAERVPAGGAHV